MYKDNKYTKWYFQIIENAKIRKSSEYTENHHILPVCLGGTNNKNNMVRLTAKEHLICHMLLTKMHDDNRLKYAVSAMCMINLGQQRYKLNANTYAYIKKCNSVATSQRLYSNHPRSNLNKIRIHDPETKEERFVLPDAIPSGWIIGMSDDTRTAIKGKNTNKIYYNDPISGNVIAIDIGDPVPVGYVRGNPKANTSGISNIKGSEYYFDTLTGIEKRINIGRGEVVPPGWSRGRGSAWITDGTSNMMYNRVCGIIPIGWKLGKTMKRKAIHE